jgi:signal transduction histidine kinase
MLGARFAPLPDGSTMAVFADVTDSERIAAALTERNEALEAAEQMRSAVLDQVSHRLRTPLNTIFGFGELLAETRAGPLNGSQETYVSGILEAASQLLDAVGAVTELASLQLDPREGESPEHSVEEVIEVTRDLLERRALDQRVNLAVEVEGAIGTVACADARLRQIVFSLVSDAIQRCPKRGTVTLRAARGPDGTVEIGTREPVDPAAGDPVARLESESVALSLVRRLIAEKEGRVEVAPLAYPPRLAVTCHVPDAEAAAALPDAGAAG